MQTKNAFLIAILLGFGFFLLGGSPVWACEPTGENLANGSKDPQCRLVLPAARVQLPARPVDPGAVAIASAGNPVINSSANISSTIDYSSNPSCFLPDGSGMTNALGIGEACPPPFLPPRAVKTATPITTTATAPLTSTVTAKTQPKGDSPYTARTMTGDWETIDPKASIWYRIDNENNFFLDVWMDTYGQPGVTFAVYSPDQINNLSATTVPKGRSAAIKSDPSHDWWWNGAQAVGIWHVLVTSSASTPMKYRIGYKQSTEQRNCHSYWEYLPSGLYVYWTACR